MYSHVIGITSKQKHRCLAAACLLSEDVANYRIVATVFFCIHLESLSFLFMATPNTQLPPGWIAEWFVLL